MWIIIGGTALLVAGVFLVWRLTSPKPPVLVPIEVQTRGTLLALRDKPENGALLSQISQALRTIRRRRFALPPGELTTTEFCQTLGGNERVGPELSSALGQFLRRCDEQKFSSHRAKAAHRRRRRMP